MDVDTVREVKFLQYLKHDNITKVYHHEYKIHQIFSKEPKILKPEKFKSLYLVMDFMIPLTDVIYNLE